METTLNPDYTSPESEVCYSCLGCIACFFPSLSGFGAFGIIGIADVEWMISRKSKFITIIRKGGEWKYE